MLKIFLCLTDLASMKKDFFKIDSLYLPSQSLLKFRVMAKNLGVALTKTFPLLQKTPIHVLNENSFVLSFILWLVLTEKYAANLVGFVTGLGSIVNRMLRPKAASLFSKQDHLLIS